MDSNTPQTLPDSASPGQLLKTAREQAEISLHEVADSLHLMPRQIDALERDDFAQFSGEVFCRGYIKSYAKLLGVNAEKVMSSYQQHCPQPEQKIALKTARTLPIQQPKKGSSIHYWFVAATLMVAFTLWYFGSAQSASWPVMSMENLPVVVDKHASINPATAMIEPYVMSAVDSEALDPDESPWLSDEVALYDDSAAFDGNLPPGEYVANNKAVASALVHLPVKNSANELADDALSLSSDEESLLSFVFEEDCWVEVKDSNNQVVFADLKRANETLSVHGKAPFNVLLGYAPGVRLSYNGEPVAINANPKNNAARMVVGQL